jgi:hypothetical protein
MCYNTASGVKMKFYQETTKWHTDTPNGIYLLNDSKTKMYAFIRAGSKSVFKFKNPIQIDSRGRMFKEIKNTFNFEIEESKNHNPQWEVKGSKGDKYIVEQTEHGLTCTCSGFKFRGKCKHLSLI